MKMQIKPLTDYSKQPFRYVVSEAEYMKMHQERFRDVYNLSYDDYCEREAECWNDMFNERFNEELSFMGLLPSNRNCTSILKENIKLVLKSL